MLYLQRNQKYYSLIKTKDMEESRKKLWTEIIRFIITVLSAVLTALGVGACTMSMTISKNNSGSTGTKIESTNRADSTNINLNNYQ
jgi:hypothetical protein